MTGFIKNTLSLILAFTLVFSSLSLVTLATEEEGAEEIEISADFAGVYNVESGEMLFEKNANTIIYPASLVKIMTATLALEYYEKNKNIATEIEVTDSALESLKGNDINLEAGEKVSFYDLVAAVVVGSANDAALVLAEHISGSVDKFVELMNKKAESLGALNTQFANPTGFHSPYMYSTISDLAKICEWANKNQEFMKLSSTLTYTMPKTNLSKERTFTNSNLLLNPTHWLRHYKSGTSGMNVGMTQEAGYTLATVYDNDGLTNIVIIVGGKSEGFDYHYFNDARTLIDYTSESYSYSTLVSKDKPVADMRVLYGKDTDHVLLTTKNEITVLLPDDYDENNITFDYTITKDEFIAPVTKGAEFGSYNVYYEGELVGSVPLVTQANIKRDYFAFVTGVIANFFALDTVRGVINLILSLLLFAVTILSLIYYVRKKRRIERMRAEKMRRMNRARRNIKQNMR